MKYSNSSALMCLIFISFYFKLVAQPLPVAKPEEVGMSSERLQRLSSVFKDYAESGKMSGSVILIMRHGKVAYFEAFGKRDIESNASMEKNTIFRIASQSKAIVSVGIMMLQEQGKLLITDPVSKYIPEFKETTVAIPHDSGGYEVVKAKRQITLRDLLTHTAGIGYGWGPAQKEWEAAGILGWYFADKDEPIARTVAKMASLPMNAQPGERFVYGYNTDILGVVIERASGMPLDAFLDINIFKPLGMNDTYFYLPQEKKSRLSVVYSANDGKPIERAPVPGGMVGQGAYVDGPRKSFSGGAGLLSTAEDYARFMQMLLNGGELNGKRILSPTTVKLMTSNQMRDIPYNPGEGFGLGFSICLDLGARGTPGSVGEFGWSGAYGSSYWADPMEDMVVIYFKQLIPTNGLDDQSKLRPLIYQAIVK